MRPSPPPGCLVLALCSVLCPIELAAQRSGSSASPVGADTVAADTAAAAGGGHARHSLAVPDSALRRAVGEWRLVADGSASAAYVRAEARKGGARFGVANWAMVSGSGPLAEGMLTLSLMGSLETLTTGECGFPGLLAGVSTCPVNAVRDFQHPHPPLMEVAARQSWRIRGPVYLDVYAGVVGQPALGPPMYLHRPSAAADPIAPISAHETNPAHASAGVITAGVGGGEWKVEGSLFNGSPPDPDRFLPEPGPLNSAAGRVSFDPSPAWAMQASLGRIDAPAGHHTGAAGTIRTLSALPRAFEPTYQTRWPTSFSLYLSVRPATGAPHEHH